MLIRRCSVILGQEPQPHDSGDRVTLLLHLEDATRGCGWVTFSLLSYEPFGQHHHAAVPAEPPMVGLSPTGSPSSYILTLFLPTTDTLDTLLRDYLP